MIRLLLLLVLSGCAEEVSMVPWQKLCQRFYIRQECRTMRPASSMAHQFDETECALAMQELLHMKLIEFPGCLP